MSKRTDHSFRFTGSQISQAADAEAIYHLDRVGFWNTEYEKALAEAKASCVQVREYDVTGGKRADLVFEPSIAGRISEATNKREKHQRTGDRFRIECAAYGTQPDREYELDADDVCYFRLAGGSRPE